MTLYQEAKQLVLQAGEIIRQQIQAHQTLHIETKSNANDLVTNVDKEIEHFFVSHIKAKYPKHHILGEEGNGHDLDTLNNKTVWIIDPIDGTLNFVQQQQNFCISVAIFIDGQGKYGFIYDVMAKCLYEVDKGNFFKVNGELVDQPVTPPIKEAFLSIGAKWTLSDVQLQKLVADVRATRDYGSAALSLAYVASNNVHIYITKKNYAWDFAAGAIMLEHQGYQLTQIDGSAVSFFEQNTIIAAPTALHEVILTQYLPKK